MYRKMTSFDPDYSEKELKAIELCNRFLSTHEHFRCHIAHATLDDYNILWGDSYILDWIECCLMRDYSRYKGEWEYGYLTECMDTLRNDYDLSEDEIDRELRALRRAVKVINGVLED